MMKSTMRASRSGGLRIVAGSACATNDVNFANKSVMNPSGIDGFNGDPAGLGENTDGTGHHRDWRTSHARVLQQRPKR